MDRIQGFILAGGKSRRMGKDKWSLSLGDKTFTQIIAEELGSIVESVSLVGGVAHDKLPSVPDIFPEWGVLGGLHAALNACTSQWALVVACDLPFVRRELLASLLDRRADFDAVVPIQQDGRPQPLCACYRIDACLTRADNLIRAGKRRPLDLLETIKTRWVEFDELKDMDQAERFFVNINTPEDYYEATRKGVN